MHNKTHLPPAVEMIDITKTFLNGKVVANDKMNLVVEQNEVHAIIGENGAGKSTLMSMLFGVYSPDSGIIKINGKQVNFESAKDASDAGLGMVHQHFKLVDEFTVWENVILGVEGVSRLEIIKQKEIKEKLQSLIDQYDFKLNVNKKVKELSVGQQQKIEILKLLYRQANILIFDEPTAVLSQNEIESFLKMIMKFQENGKTVIIITHKLSEIKSVANIGTVIRRGKYIDRFKIANKSIDSIAELMVGHKITPVINEHHSLENKKIKFEVSNLDVHSQWLSSITNNKFWDKLVNAWKIVINSKELTISEKWKEFLKNFFNKHNVDNNKLINFQIRAGEIFAIAGVEGNGQSELSLMLSGILSSGKAKIIINNIDVSGATTNKRNRSGLSAVPEDRHKYGLVLDMPIDKNIVLDQIDNKPYSYFGFINHNRITENAIKIIKKYDVRGTSRGTTMARSLSGGNQQKLIIGREMEKEHEVLILTQPTRGMDLGAINYIHKQILKEKEDGKAILLISYELDEILTLADTIAVMQNGTFLKIGSSKMMTKSKIGELMTGKKGE